MARTEPPINTNEPLSLRVSYNGAPVVTEKQAMPLDPAPAPNEQWEDITKPAETAALGASFAQEDAAKAMQEAKESGLEPAILKEGSALDPTTPRFQRVFESFRQSIEDTPGLWAYASRSPVHAAFVAEDAEHWSAAEKFLTGKIEQFPVPKEAVGPWAEYLRQHGGTEPQMDAPPVWMSAMQQGAAKAWLSMKAFALHAWGPGFSQDAQASWQKELEKEQQEISGPLRGVAGAGSEAVAKVAGMAPQMAGLALGSLLGPETTFGMLYAQSVGDLKLAGVDDGFAMGGGFLAASFGTFFGYGLFKSMLLPREEAYAASLAGVNALRASIKNPVILSTLGKLGRHFTYGLLLNESMAISQSLAVQLNYGGVSKSRLYEDALAAGEDTINMLPYLAVSPIREHLEMHGRWVEAHETATRIGGGLAAVGSTKAAQTAPGEMRGVLSALGSRPVYLDPKIVESAAKTLGVDPSSLARQMTGRAGALETAQNSGTPLRVPMGELAPLHEMAEQVAQHAKFEPDGSTLKEAQKEAPELIPESERMKIYRDALVERSPHDPLVKWLDGKIKEAEGKKTVRFFHGGTEPDGSSRWLTPHLDYAEGYAKKSGGSVYYVDVPENHPALESAYDETNKYYMNFEAPPEIAKGLKPMPKASAPEPTGTGPLPGTGEGSKPELRRYAEDAVSRMTATEVRGSKGVYERAEREAQRGLEASQAQAVEKLAKATGQAQAGIEKGVAAAEQGRASSQSNLNFARTARFREWLKGLSTGGDTKPVKIEAPYNAETGLYNIPEVNVEVPESEARKFYKLGEAQRRHAIALYKQSEKTQGQAEDQYVKAATKTVEAGDAAQDAMRYERVRDLNRAMGAARAKAEKEADRIENYVDKQGSDSIRESTYKAGAHFGVVYDSIMEGLGKRVPDGRTPRLGIDEALRMIELGGDTLGFDQGHIRELSARPRPLDDMLPWEAANVENAIRDIRRLANQASKTYAYGKEIERAGEIVNMDAALAKGSKGGKFTTGERAPGKEQRKAENASADSLWRVYGKYGDDRMHQLDYALKLESDLQGKFLPKLEIPKELLELAKKDAPLPNFDRSDPRLGFLPGTVKQRDLWRAARMAGNTSGMAKLAAGYGVDEMEIERWLKENIKSKAEWDFIDQGWQTNEELWSLESVVHAQRSGLSPVKLQPREWVVRFEDGSEKTYKGGYDPFRWQPYGRGTPPPVSAQDILMGMRRFGIGDSPHAFLKERMESFYNVPDISWAALKSHYNAVLHDISHSNFVRDTHRMIYDPAFERMTLNRLGEPWLKALREWLNVTTLGRVVREEQGGEWYNAMFREGKGIAAAAAFNLNFPVVGGQLAHFLIGKYGLNIPYEHMTKGFSAALTPEGWKEAGESPVVGFRWDRYSSKLNRMWQEQLGYGANPYRDALARASQEAQHLMDGYLTRGFYLAAKSQALAEGKPLEEAMVAGDTAARRAMPALTVEHGSQITRNRTYGLLTMVRNFPNTVINMKTMIDWQTRVNIADGENAPWARTKQIGQLTGIAAGLGVGLYLMGHGRKEGERWWQYGARTALTESTYGAPFLHLAAQALAPTLVGEGVGKVNWFNTPIGDTLDRLTQDVGKLAQRDRPMDKKMWDALDALGRAFGAPLPPPMLRSAQGAYKLARYHMLGRSDFYRTPRGGLDEASIAVYGERRESTPLTDAQKLIGGAQ